MLVHSSEIQGKTLKVARKSQFAITMAGNFSSPFACQEKIGRIEELLPLTFGVMAQLFVWQFNLLKRRVFNPRKATPASRQCNGLSQFVAKGTI